MNIPIDGDSLVQIIKFGRFVRTGRFRICVCGKIYFHRTDSPRLDRPEWGHMTGLGHFPWMNGAVGWLDLPYLNGSEEDPDAAAVQIAKTVRHRLNQVPYGHPIEHWWPRDHSTYVWMDVERKQERKERIRRASPGKFVGFFMWVAGKLSTVHKTAGDLGFSLLGYVLTPVELLTCSYPRMLEAVRNRSQSVELHVDGSDVRVITRSRIRAVEIVREEYNRE